MANRTNSSEYFWSYEYYWDYIDPIPVDGSKLKVNKYGRFILSWSIFVSGVNDPSFHFSLNSVVIAFWVGLAAFVTFLFLILLYMSRSGSPPVKKVMVGNQTEESRSNGGQPHCNDLSSPYSDVVASQTPTSLSDETGNRGRSPS